MQKAFFAEPAQANAVVHHEASDHHTSEALPPITLPERLGAILLIATSITIGIYPQILLKLIVPALNSPLFDGIRRGSWQ